MFSVNRRIIFVIMNASNARTFKWHVDIFVFIQSNCVNTKNACKLHNSRKALYINVSPHSSQDATTH